MLVKPALRVFSVICGYSVLKDLSVYRVALRWEVEAVYYASVSLLLNVSFFVAFVVGIFNRWAYDVCSWVVTFVSVVEFCHAFQSVARCCGFSPDTGSSVGCPISVSVGHYYCLNLVSFWPSFVMTVMMMMMMINWPSLGNILGLVDNSRLLAERCAVYSSGANSVDGSTDIHS